VVTNFGCAFVDLVVVASVGVGLWGARLLLEELFMADSRESSGLVDNRGSINPLVDGDGLVNGGGLDGFSLDNGLDGLVDVMVLVLVGGDTNVGSASLGLTLDGGVLVSGPLLVELSLMLWVHLLLVLSSDDGSGSSGVLSRKNLVVLYRLYSVLVVVDVLLPVDGLSGLDVFLGSDILLDNFGSDFGADLGRVLLVGSLEEVLDAIGDTRHCVDGL